jgi:hypothetical protein
LDSEFISTINNLVRAKFFLLDFFQNSFKQKLDSLIFNISVLKDELDVLISSNSDSKLIILKKSSIRSLEIEKKI